jgi:hypothetical protein
LAAAIQTGCALLNPTPRARSAAAPSSTADMGCPATSPRAAPSRHCTLGNAWSPDVPPDRPVGTRGRPRRSPCTTDTLRGHPRMPLGRLAPIPPKASPCRSHTRGS